ncbi:copper chaperone PCu(A)C [Jatrophihabitans sp.]|uniref:copper chaperone PCu(A)C n=1 Tax=Jatrophihabitans sp. TaxID=1932789 RepID=UPI002C4C83E8|nr:copper chaperone PCu(A)C [Jatrophihabitans sp.]
MKRIPVSMVLAVLLAVAGAAGLVRGAMSNSPAAADVAAAPEQPIVASGGYVREPANGVNAAAYFTLYNTTGTPDVLTGVDSGAGEQTTLHSDSRGGMRQISGLSIPAHGSVSLRPGEGHVMIDKLYSPLEAGQSVNFRLTFAKAGQLLLTVPVIAIGAPAPTAEAPR